MVDNAPTERESNGPRSPFATTDWSVILAAGEGGGSPASFDALSRLCQTYWCFFDDFSGSVRG